ncbi:MAG: GNAT family N-acetyltransferase [Deltaproteobacteria bacterium]|nr:GNAT family N-acetyltransferase [Deltaproteobacteria bacterium]
MPCTIEPLKHPDLEALALLWRRSREGAQPWLELRMGYTPAEDLSFLRNVVAQECDMWVAREGPALLGFLALAGEKIEQLYVDPLAQGTGVGTALLDRARQLSPTRLTLFTHLGNSGARAFYERRDFHAVAFGTSPPPESEPDVTYVWEP